MTGTKEIQTEAFGLPIAQPDDPTFQRVRLVIVDGAMLRHLASTGDWSVLTKRILEIIPDAKLRRFGDRSFFLVGFATSDFKWIEFDTPSEYAHGRADVVADYWLLGVCSESFGELPEGGAFPIPDIEIR